jgi:hypothetical protein
LKRTNIYKCQQCGFRNDGRNTTWSNGTGDGNTLVKPPTSFTYSKAQNSTTNPIDWTVNGGCRMCGSFRATPVKTRPLPVADQRVPLKRWQIKQAGQ